MSGKKIETSVTTPEATTAVPSADGETLELSPAALSLMAEFFKVLSEVSRLQIVCCLKSGAKNVTEIIEATDLGQANVSKHLKILTQAGILLPSRQKNIDLTKIQLLIQRSSFEPQRHKERRE